MRCIVSEIWKEEEQLLRRSIEGKSAKEGELRPEDVSNGKE